jgi:ribosomal protein L37E
MSLLQDNTGILIVANDVEDRRSNRYQGGTYSSHKGSYLSIWWRRLRFFKRFLIFERRCFQIIWLITRIRILITHVECQRCGDQRVNCMIRRLKCLWCGLRPYNANLVHQFQWSVMWPYEPATERRRLIYQVLIMKCKEVFKKRLRGCRMQGEQWISAGLHRI